MNDAFAMLQCERWGGPSVNGWSRLQDYLRCPYRYQLKHIRRVRSTIVGDSSPAQDVGAIGHVILAAYYAAYLRDDRYPGYRMHCPTVDAVIDALETAGADPSALQTVCGVWSGYIDHWGEDGFQPMAVEMGAGDPLFHTSRYDLVAYVEDAIHDGFWIVEHKWLSPQADLELYRFDGEILGECLSWRLSHLDDVFGPLAGVCVNILLKGRVPTYKRMWLPVDWDQVGRFAADRESWNAQLHDQLQRDSMPRSNYGCMARFDRCAFWDHCSTQSNSFLTPKDVK